MNKGIIKDIIIVLNYGQKRGLFSNKKIQNILNFLLNELTIPSRLLKIKK